MTYTLVTGSTGFIGTNLKDKLVGNIIAPTRAELDLTDADKTREYLRFTKPDKIIHCGSNDKDVCLYDNLRMFHNLAESGIPMISFCTGREIEDRSYKNGEYVLSKYITKELAIHKYKHISVIQLWGCFGTNEKPLRFFKGNMLNVLRGEPIQVDEDRLFSYVYVDDVVGILQRTDIPQSRVIPLVAYTDSFSNYADLLRDITGSRKPVVVKSKNFTHSYVGKNASWIDGTTYTPLREALVNMFDEVKRGCYAPGM